MIPTTLNGTKWNVAFIELGNPVHTHTVIIGRPTLYCVFSYCSKYLRESFHKKHNTLDCHNSEDKFHTYVLEVWGMLKRKYP